MPYFMVELGNQVEKNIDRKVEREKTLSKKKRRLKPITKETIEKLVEGGNKN